MLRAHKRASTATAIRRGFIPPRLIVPLAQYRASTATPSVTPGQRVLRGELLAAAGAARSTAIHAPTSGTITAITSHPVLLGAQVLDAPCIVIDTDGEDAEPVDSSRSAWPDDRTARLAAIRDGGIVGLGGAVFPTADKLADCLACEALIINGAECEPYISCDDMLMREQAAAVVDGALLLADLLDAPQCIIAIEGDKTDALRAIREAAQTSGDARLRVAQLPALYPAGGERQLIELLTGREIPTGCYPGDRGILTHNVGTAHAVHRLARHQEPLLSRIVTLTGGAIASPGNVEVLIGTPVRDLIEWSGGYRQPPSRLIAGGSMMGIALDRDDLPVTRATNCLLAAAPGELREDHAEWPCIRCGDCATACPVRLLPQELLRAARHNDSAALGTLALRDCIECGCCDAVCPSHITLTEHFRHAKLALTAQAQRTALSTESAVRYSLREQRRQQEQDDIRSRQTELKAQVSTNRNADARRRAIEEARQRARQRKAGASDDASDTAPERSIE